LCDVSVVSRWTEVRLTSFITVQSSLFAPHVEVAAPGVARWDVQAILILQSSLTFPRQLGTLSAESIRGHRGPLCRVPKCHKPCPHHSGGPASQLEVQRTRGAVSSKRKGLCSRADGFASTTRNYLVSTTFSFLGCVTTARASWEKRPVSAALPARFAAKVARHRGGRSGWLPRPEKARAIHPGDAADAGWGARTRSHGDSTLRR
jgi:hypothetical protein